MENVISFTFANWITVLVMAGTALIAFLAIIKGGELVVNKLSNKE